MVSFLFLFFLFCSDFGPAVPQGAKTDRCRGQRKGGFCGEEQGDFRRFSEE